MTRLPKYRIGQVVRINDYDYDMRAERFQEIDRIIPREKSFEYELANGDHCQEKFLKPLTKRQKGER